MNIKVFFEKMWIFMNLNLKKSICQTKAFNFFLQVVFAKMKDGKPTYGEK